MKRTRLARRTPLRPHRRVKPLRKKLWPEFSRLIRTRDGKCLMAGQEFGKCGGSLQASHIYPKGKYPLLELFPLNVKTLCYVHHHFTWHRNPMECAAWVRRVLPQDWIDRLLVAKANSLGRKRMDEAAIRAEWKHFGLTA